MRNWQAAPALLAIVVPMAAVPLYGAGRALRPVVDLEHEPLLVVANGEESEIPAQAIADASGFDPARCLVVLRETAGAQVTVRMTPQVPAPAPPNPGRAFVLSAGERRLVRLGDEFDATDLSGNDVLVEGMRGGGRVAVSLLCGEGADATTLSDERLDEAMPAATTGVRPVRRRLARLQTSSAALIDQAVAAGTLDRETGLVYKTFAQFGDARLPAQYRGDDAYVFDSLQLDDVIAALPTMSPAHQALVQPYLIQPAYQGSWASGPASVRATVPQAQPSCNPFDTNWSWVERPGGSVRVWFRPTEDNGVLAQSVLDAVEDYIWGKLAGVMTGHVPLFDDGESCNGGNLTVDIYLVESAGDPGITIPYHSGGAATPAYIEVVRNTNLRTLLAVVAHELFHAFQYSYSLPSDLMSSDYDWWAEASATWAEDFAYSSANTEWPWASVFIGHPEKPLDYTDASTKREYGAYLVPFYVYHKTGSAAFVGTAWLNCTHQPAVQALDAALPGGFAAIWPEVALHNLNDKPVDQYKTWDRLEASARRIVPDLPVTLSGSPEREYTISYQLPRLSASYSNYDFQYAGTQVRSVVFWNGATFDLEKQAVPVIGPLWNPQPASAAASHGIKVQAVIEIAGQAPKVEDWTGTPYATYCRDMTAERLQHLSIIISNSELTDRSGLVTPPGEQPRLVISNMGCWQWKGTAHYTEVANDDSQTDDVEVTWTRVASQPPPRIQYQPSGGVTVTMGGTCSGGGSFPLSTAGSLLETYNFTPLDSPADRSYKGQAYDATVVNITCKGNPGMTFVGPWFAVLPPNPPQFPFYQASTDGSTLSGSYTAGGSTWTWELHAQSQP